MVNRLKLKPTLLKTGYAVLVGMAVLGMLEFTARALGLGDPIIYYNSPWGGLRPLPDQQVSRQKGSTVTIDANGFRSTGSDSESAFRILYLGDSVTWGGSSVDDTELFSEVAAGVLRRSGLEVYAMNAGVNGTSLMNQAGVFEQWKDSVDAVVWLFPWNDMHRSFVSAGYLWPPTKRPSFALVEAMDHIIRTRWLTSFRQNPSTTGAEFILPETPAGYEQLFKTVLNERTRMNLKALLQTMQIALLKDIPVIVGVTPRRGKDRLLPIMAEAAETMKMLKTMDVRVLDVGALLPTGTGLESAYIDRVHFTAVGHRLIGEALGSELLKIVGDLTAAAAAPLPDDSPGTERHR